MTITQRQNLLQYLGYYEGKVDGIWGAISAAAAKEFQKDSGLSATGICDAKTDELLKSAVFYGKLKKPVVTTVDFGTKYAPKYFERSEFACKCGEHCNGFPVEPDAKLLKVLDQIREHFGKPVIVNSGIRCKAHNTAVGGASNSQHLYGTAADIAVEGVAPLTVYKYAETLLPNSGGIGLYTWGVHVDVRAVKARWNG